MSKIDQVFAKLRAEKRRALMPFITAGDPDLEFTADAIREFDRRGAALCEIGVPYSDPIADGPVIQESYTRSLARGISLAKIFAMIGGVSGQVQMPLVLMVSYAIVYRQGLENFVKQAKTAGLAGLIVPDLPASEAAALSKLCREADLSLVQLITPTTSRERAVEIAKQTTGFIYYVSVTGITGERTELPADLLESVSWLRGQTELPVSIGFGISSPEHVRRLKPIADGLIVGSAIVRRIAAGSELPRAKLAEQVGDYVAELNKVLAE